MSKQHYLALLRGINVGGNNIIKMAALKACIEGMGFHDVVTYIQSGNVLLSSPEKNMEKLTEKIEKGLSKTFHYNARVVVISFDLLKETVKGAPQGFGREPAKFHYDVIFLKSPMTPKEAMTQVTTKEGVDQAHAGKKVLYFSRLNARAPQSNLPRIIKKPVYQSMTIRNWNTTTKLLAMMEERV